MCLSDSLCKRAMTAETIIMSSCRVTQNSSSSTKNFSQIGSLCFIVMMFQCKQPLVDPHNVLHHEEDLAEATIFIAYIFKMLFCILSSAFCHHLLTRCGTPPLPQHINMPILLHSILVEGTFTAAICCKDFSLLLHTNAPFA